MVPLNSEMRTYIHDPEFEDNFIESDNEEQMTFGDRLSVLTAQYNNIDNMELSYVRALLRDLFDLYDECEQEGELYYMRESLYLAFKSLVTPNGREIVENDRDFEELCIWRADLCLTFIEDLEENEYDPQWEDTANAIIDFLNVVSYVRT